MAGLPGRASVADRYIAWAFRERKIRTPTTETRYREVLTELATAIDKPLENLSEVDLREYQFALRHSPPGRGSMIHAMLGA